MIEVKTKPRHLPQMTEHVRSIIATSSRDRRLPDKILIAFHHACDQSDYDIARQLLHIVENMLTRRTASPDSNRRKNIEFLVAAHERLWHLCHPEHEEQNHDKPAEIVEVLTTNHVAYARPFISACVE